MKFPSLALPLALWATAAVILTGCGANHASQRTALDCPLSQGTLKRTSMSGDGRTCVYADADGDEVSLRLIPVVGTPQATLSPIERELQALVPTASPPPAVAHKDDDEAAAKDGDRADITLPGVRIQATGKKANVQVGTLHVDATDNGAVIREARNTRLMGEQLSMQRRGYRASYIVARNDLTGGLTSVGYEAGGPRSGPLTVAILKMKSQDQVLHRDVRRLVRRNGGI
jgi:hypothetical protein